MSAVSDEEYDEDDAGPALLSGPSTSPAKPTSVISVQEDVDDDIDEEDDQEEDDEEEDEEVVEVSEMDEPDTVLYRHVSCPVDLIYISITLVSKISLCLFTSCSIIIRYLLSRMPFCFFEEVIQFD
jgi:hypothetical protein